LIVMARRYEDGSRRVEGLYEVPDMSEGGSSNGLATIPLWEWEQTGTDENGRLLGRYVKRNDISESLYAAKGLEFGKKYSWEELCILCGREELANMEEQLNPPVESASGVMLGDAPNDSQEIVSIAPEEDIVVENPVSLTDHNEVSLEGSDDEFI
jgi:hypothetical protein